MEADAGIREFTAIAELAEREGIASSYMTHVLRLTLLAPYIVEAILDGRHGPEVTLARVLEPFPLDWNAQRLAWTDTTPSTANGEQAAPERMRSS